MNLPQVNLFVADFSTMLRFYRDVLGFEANDIEPGPPCVPMANWASPDGPDAFGGIRSIATYLR